jgi:hypothetical protein
MKIKIGVGIDNIIFGMSQEEVKNLVGSPDKVSNTEWTYGVVLTFNSIMTKFKFDQKEDLRLVSIETFYPDTTMFNQRIIGKEKQEIEALLHSLGYCNIEYEEFDFFETIHCDEVAMTFEFEFNRLRGIEFSPLFDSNEEIVWP